jgi:hypothetical protein
MGAQNNLIFKGCNSGEEILASNKAKIFDLKFSATGGT